MAGQWGAVLVTLPFVAVLSLLAGWADRHFRRFGQLPGHFDFRGRATRMTARRTITWGLPILFSVTLLVIAFATALTPREYRNGSSFVGAFISGFGIVGAQLLVLWLTERWAREQPRD